MVIKDTIDYLSELDPLHRVRLLVRWLAAAATLLLGVQSRSVWFLAIGTLLVAANGVLHLLGVLDRRGGVGRRRSTIGASLVDVALIGLLVGLGADNSLPAVDRLALATMAMALALPYGRRLIWFVSGAYVLVAIETTLRLLGTGRPVDPWTAVGISWMGLITVGLGFSLLLGRLIREKVTVQDSIRELERAKEQQRILYDAAVSLALQPRPAEALDEIACAAVEVLNALFGVVLVYNQRRRPRLVGSYKLADSRHWHSLMQQAFGTPNRYGPRGVQEGELSDTVPTAVPDIHRDPAWTPWLDHASKIGFRSMVSAPLTFEDKPIGLLNVYLASEHAFSQRELELLNSLASFAAAVVHREQIYRTAEILASSDPLTGLTNLRSARPYLRGQVAMSQRTHRPLTVMMVDLNNFKWLNDALGHQAGDRLLAELGPAMQGCIRHSDMVARYGGDEFLFILPDTDDQGSLSIQAKVSAVLAQLPSNLAQPRITASFGAASFEVGITAEELLQAADVALYEQKRVYKQTPTAASG